MCDCPVDDLSDADWQAFLDRILEPTKRLNRRKHGLPRFYLFGLCYKDGPKLLEYNVRLETLKRRWFYPHDSDFFALCQAP